MVIALIINGLLIYIMLHAILVCDRCLKYAELITGLTYDLLSVLFLVVGYFIQMRLKKYFPKFYSENKNRLWFATFALFLSLMLRGFIDTFRYFSTKFNKALTENESLSNIILFLVCDIVPICFQLSTLIFGYIRRKKEERYKLEV